MNAAPFSPKLTVEEALQKGQQTPRVFIEHKTACVGCYLMHFCTLEDVAKTYGLPLEDFLDELRRAAQTNHSASIRSKNEATV
jgi:hybrid cluster-associated redox disulfide protein